MFPALFLRERSEEVVGVFELTVSTVRVRTSQNDETNVKIYVDVGLDVQTDPFVSPVLTSSLRSVRTSRRTF